MSFATLSHSSRMLSKGFKSMICYSRLSHLVTSHRMIGQFKFEIHKLADGFKILKQKCDMAAESKYDNVKAVIIWKVRRLVLAVRAWGKWARNKRERRCMILKARGEGQRGIKVRACRYWLSMAAAISEHDQIVRTKALIVRAAKKWKSLVVRNRYLRERKGGYESSVVLFNTDINAGLLRVREGELVPNTGKATMTAVSSTSSSAMLKRTQRTQSTINDGKDKEKTFDLLKAKPRLLDDDSYPRSHLFRTAMLPKAQSCLFPSPSDRWNDEVMKSSMGDANDKKEKQKDKNKDSEIYVNSGKKIDIYKQEGRQSIISQRISESSRLGLAYSMPRILSPSQDYTESKQNLNESLNFTEIRKIDLNVPCGIFEKEKDISKEKNLLAQEIIEFITEMRNMEQLLFIDS